MASNNRIKALFNSWGVSLYYLAEMKSGEETLRLYKESTEKFEAALKVEPDYEMALVSWACCLLGLAEIGTGEEREKFINLAESKLLKAEEISPGLGSYNLACVAALRCDGLECKRWLENADHFGTLQSVNHMKKDRDFDFVRHEKWFKEILRTQRHKEIIGYLKKHIFWL